MSFRLLSAVIELPNGKLVRIDEDRSYRGVIARDQWSWDGSLYGPPFGAPPELADALDHLFPLNREEASA